MIEQLLAGIPKQARGFRAEVGLILGSGVGPFAEMIDRSMVVSYADLPGFPRSGVVGHAGRLILGWIGQTPVAALQGRAHYYEHGNPSAMKAPIETLAALGCKAVIVTNAGGSLSADVPAGLGRDDHRPYQPDPGLAAVRRDPAASASSTWSMPMIRRCGLRSRPWRAASAWT